jgi:hypothetical protein
MSKLSRGSRGIAAGIISVVFLLSFSCLSAFADTANGAAYALTCLNVAPGANGAELGFAWLTGY